MALSEHANGSEQCLLSQAKRTWPKDAVRSANDPNRTLAARDFCAAHCRTLCQFRLAHFPVLMVSTNGSAAHKQQPDPTSEVRPGILTRCHERVPGNERKRRL